MSEGMIGGLYSDKRFCLPFFAAPWSLSDSSSSLLFFFFLFFFLRGDLSSSSPGLRPNNTKHFIMSPIIRCDDSVLSPFTETGEFIFISTVNANRAADEIIPAAHEPAPKGVARIKRIKIQTWLLYDVSTRCVY